MLESLIEHGEYNRNRKRISSRLGISSAALSQYIHQHTWPSFTKLLAIADFFDVSLDYLVYGQPTGGSLVDYGPLYRYFDHALADVQARAAGITPSSPASDGCWRIGSRKSRQNWPRRRPRRVKASYKTMSYCGLKDTATNATWRA